VESEFYLRDVTGADLPVFFNQQLDPDANQMAAFTAKNPSDRWAFDSRWARIMASSIVISKAIIYQGRVAGHISSYVEAGRLEIGYWLGKEFWRKGLATLALTRFLAEVNGARPIYARVAEDNLASRRVLEKCGFQIIGNDRGFANARGEEITELILVLADEPISG
jgi:RimJ/RimL family protein N-acetyltransferase